MTTYLKVAALKDLFEFEKDEDDARWQESLRKSGVDGDLDVGLVDEDGCEVYSEFEDDELEATDAVYYNFMGGRDGEDERFYAEDITVYKSPDGKLWVVDCDELWEF